MTSAPREDPEYLPRAQGLPATRIRGVETRGCPHTAIREDASINLAVVARTLAPFVGEMIPRIMS